MSQQGKVFSGEYLIILQDFIETMEGTPLQTWLNSMCDTKYLSKCEAMVYLLMKNENIRIYDRKKYKFKCVVLYDPYEYRKKNDDLLRVYNFIHGEGSSPVKTHYVYSHFIDDVTAIYDEVDGLNLSSTGMTHARMNLIEPGDIGDWFEDYDLDFMIGLLLSDEDFKIQKNYKMDNDSKVENE